MRKKHLFILNLKQSIMLDNLLKEGAPELLSSLANKFNLSSAQAGNALDVTTETLQGDLLNEAKSGNVDGILSLFNGQSSSATSSLTGKLTNSLAKNLLSKVGISNEIAVKVSEFIIPFVIERISNKKPSGGFTSESIIDLFKGSLGSQIQDKASDLLKGGLGGLFK